MCQVKLTPLPLCAATFLGLLEDNRMGLDSRGNYVRVSGECDTPRKGGRSR